MKISIDTLFIGTFVICACPWFVYMFYVIKNMKHTAGTLLSGLHILNPLLRWQENKLDRESNPVAKQVWEQGVKWMKICFITWTFSFILLVLLMLSLVKLGWLANQSGVSSSATSQPR